MATLSLAFASGERSLSARRFSIKEALSTLFEIQVLAVSSDGDLDLASIVGHPAWFRIDAAGTLRLWSGLCRRMQQIGVEPDGLSTYELTIVPSLWLLTQRRNHRIFQHESVPGIVRGLLAERGLETFWKIDEEAYPRLPQRVQYGESDYAFMSRLLEEAGISFSFTNDPEKGSLPVFHDRPQAEEPWDPVPFLSRRVPAPQSAPELDVLERRPSSRQFRRMSAPEIAGQVLSDHGFRIVWELDRKRFRKRREHAQRDETDRAFLERILAEEGAAFALLPAEEEGQPRRTVRLFERSTAQEAAVGHVSNVRIRWQVRPDKVVLRDFDVLAQRAVKGRAEAGSDGVYEQYRYEPGAFLVERDEAPDKLPLADDRGIARTDADVGRALAERALNSLQADRQCVRFETNLPVLRPGVVFRMGAHPHPDLAPDKPLLVTRFSLEGELDRPWLLRGDALPAGHPYHPPQLTPKPKVHGVQSAIVVGPAGEEIHTDEYGRVRVQFHWNREGRFDQGVSGWVRVSQGWAGPGYGVLALPRVGHEVLVRFLEGDPDNPVIVGRAHNGQAPPPFKLPDNATVSTWRSDTTPGSNGGNEIRFEDAAGREHFYVQAERDLAELIKRKAFEAVDRDSAQLVRNDETIAVGRDDLRVVHDTESETIGGSRRITVGREQRATFGQRETVRVGERFVLQVDPTLRTWVPDAVEGSMNQMLAALLNGPAEQAMGQIPTTPLGAADDAKAKDWQGPMAALPASVRQRFESVHNVARNVAAPALLNGPAEQAMGQIPTTPLGAADDAKAKDWQGLMAALPASVRQRFESVHNVARNVAAPELSNIEPASAAKLVLEHGKITLSNGQASVVLDGPNIILAATGKVSFVAKTQISAKKILEHNPLLTIINDEPPQAGTEAAGAAPLTAETEPLTAETAQTNPLNPPN
jgi:type VI secretion system secreted protein VgrG